MEFKKICVLGLGYIGLPTASTFATHGVQVVGVDVNQRVVEVLRNGEIHIHEPGLRTLVQAAFHSENLRVTEQPEPADAFIIAVPTPITPEKQADMQYVVAATESIVPHIQAGNLVMLESTSPPRTTVDLLAPILERSGLKAGEDFFLAYSPERVLPGRILQELIENARVIGGINRVSAEAGRDLYSLFVRGEILLADATSAEMVKLMENTYRDTNIALANEFSRLGLHYGVDIWRAIEIANLHPRVNILKPGPGVGGHCVSVDPWFLVEGAPELTPLIRQAREVNDAQPENVIALVEETLGDLKGRRITALGLSYKPNVDDLRESPAIEIVRALVGKGAEVLFYEPFAQGAEVEGAREAPSLEEAFQGSEGIVLLVDHKVFHDLDPTWVAGFLEVKTAIDACGAWDRQVWRDAGFQIEVLGVGKENG
ncbi:MAG: nucleotide sugar dehydrogenase [Anaerolineales bacterium]|nr:MAG: nucleotide sugar dehydrogenase [Anaerolineales bacterium]